MICNMFCKHCGKQIGADTKFCIYCGQAVTRDAQKPAVLSAPSAQVSSDSASASIKRVSIAVAAGMGALLVLGLVFALVDTVDEPLAGQGVLTGASTPEVASSTNASRTAKAEEVGGIPKVGNLAYAEPSSQPTEYGSFTVAQIVSGWQNRIAEVSCTNAYGEEMNGAATLVALPQGLMAVSNDHVIDDGSGYWPTVCVVGVYGLGGRVVSYDSTRFTSFRNYGLDYAQVNLENADYESDEGTFDIVANNYMPICKAYEVGIGDEIVILGYPWNGSQSSVTASRGIVSGYDEDYYVTDAKIEHGNSGGAAILMKKNCWLGIPTAAVVGGVESYGRILKGELVLE